MKTEKEKAQCPMCGKIVDKDELLYTWTNVCLSCDKRIYDAQGEKK